MDCWPPAPPVHAPGVCNECHVAACGVLTAAWTNICKMSQVWWCDRQHHSASLLFYHPFHPSTKHLSTSSISITLTPATLSTPSAENWSQYCVLTWPQLSDGIHLSHGDGGLGTFSHNLMILIIHFTMVQLIEYHCYIVWQCDMRLLRHTCLLLRNTDSFVVWVECGSHLGLEVILGVGGECC